MEFNDFKRRMSFLFWLRIASLKRSHPSTLTIA